MDKNMLSLVLNLLLLAISPKLGKPSRILTGDDVSSPEPELSNGVVAPVPASASVAKEDLSFYMHDILRWLAPSDRVVAGNGIVANTQTTGLPFAKRNGAVSPPSGEILKGQTQQGSTLERLIFGTITVINDELTEGQGLGSSVIGKAQGFYLSSSEDGTSHTMAFTTLFGDDEEDSMSFFGIHRTATEESLIAVVGGTGKFAGTQGYATIQTLHLNDQYTTDGVDTILQFSVYLSLFVL